MKDLIKSLLINAAYQGATAVCESAQGGNQIPIDPLIQDSGLQSKGVMVYEEAKIQYAAIVRAFEDRTGVWPDPKVNEAATPTASAPGAGSSDPVALIGTIANVLAKAVPATRPIGSVADIIGILQTITGAGQVKSPGQEIPATPAK